jgi:tRNA-2-methylthio-N6-dimethylallyladenosine synthase
MNDHDAERIAGLLEKMGLVGAASPESADVLVFNTCSIREKADTRLGGHLGTAARLKKSGSAQMVVVAGCLAQSRREDLLDDFPFVDVLVGPQSLHELPGLLERSLASGEVAGAFQEETTLWSADLPRKRVSGPMAWVQIVAGCSNFCSYCIVPHVRGPEASRPADDILAEVAALAGSGVKQVTLLGQNVNAYGQEPGFAGGISFAELLSSACAVPGIERVRFMTSHPKDMSDELIEVLAADNAVCEHLHLPVQSGSDRVLAAMRRGYDRAHYVELVRRVRAKVPGIALTTDIIVGFPGETEEDFADTLSLVDECGFDAAFTFIYSPRRQTEAARLPGRIDAQTAEARMARLVQSVQRWGLIRNQALLGQRVEVMVERPSRHRQGDVMGRTRGNKPVNFASTARPGDMVMVEVVEATSTSLRGRQVG